MKNEVCSKQSLATCFMLSLLYNQEDGGNMSLKNTGQPSVDYMSLYPRSRTLFTALLFFVIIILTAHPKLHNIRN
jgi:hypothetical protein